MFCVLRHTHNSLLYHVHQGGLSHCVTRGARREPSRRWPLMLSRTTQTPSLYTGSSSARPEIQCHGFKRLPCPHCTCFFYRSAGKRGNLLYHVPQGRQSHQPLFRSWSSCFTIEQPLLFWPAWTLPLSMPCCGTLCTCFTAWVNHLLISVSFYFASMDCGNML
jgi:hypothetical protein